MNTFIHPRMALAGGFSLNDFTRSPTAKRLGLYNIPRDVSVVANLKALCERVLVPIEATLGRRLQVVSAYRTVTLNRLLGGAPDSQHLTGEGADIIVPGLDTAAVAFTMAALDGLPFDRLVLTHRTLADGRTQSYIHISHRRLGGGTHAVETCFHDADGATRTLPGIHGLEVEEAAA